MVTEAAHSRVAVAVAVAEAAAVAAVAVVVLVVAVVRDRFCKMVCAFVTLYRATCLLASVARVYSWEEEEVAVAVVAAAAPAVGYIK